jgi:hypothetical protein
MKIGLMYCFRAKLYYMLEGQAIGRFRQGVFYVNPGVGKSSILTRNLPIIIFMISYSIHYKS